MGATLMAEYPDDWRGHLKSLKNIDWSRRNIRQWEGRALLAGRISKANSNVQLTAAFLKSTLGLNLTPDEMVLEQELQRRMKWEN
jgi:DNA sulfur modification protein DndB